MLFDRKQVWTFIQEMEAMSFDFKYIDELSGRGCTFYSPLSDLCESQVCRVCITRQKQKMCAVKRKYQ